MYILVYIYVYIYIYMYLYINVYIYPYIYTHTHTHTHTQIYIYIFIYMYARNLTFYCFIYSSNERLRVMNDPIFCSIKVFWSCIIIITTLTFRLWLLKNIYLPVPMTNRKNSIIFIHLAYMFRCGKRDNCKMPANKWYCLHCRRTFVQSGFQLTVTEWIKQSGGARGVMVIVVGHGHGDTSSNPGRDWLHFT